MRTRVSSIALTVLLGACSSSGAPPGERSDERALPESALQARIEEGRALLDHGQPAEAEAVFAELAAADGNSLRTRMWVLRAWMDQGRSNDTLDALDELSRAGEKGLEMTYLYGMAFARRAEGHIAAGVTDSSIEMNFQDAVQKLHEVVQADPARYHDAFLPLARAAWYVQELDTARWAADHVVEVEPGSAEGWLGRGRIAMSQFVGAQGEEGANASAETHWSDAVSSFRRAIELYGAPAEERAQAGLVEAATQLGHAMLWKGKAADATDAYATAIAWDPQGFDYGQAVEALRGGPADDDRPSGFGAALELGKERFEAHGQAADPRLATLYWWLGWARFVEADWSGAEQAFQDALARQPEYANCWFYIGLARQYRKESESALQAMHAGWDADPAAMVQTIAGAGGSLRGFEGLLSWCAEQEPPRNLEAVFLAEMLAEAFPDEARYWNNVGLFLRDEGERLEIDAHKNKTTPPAAELLADLYGRAFQAYQRALELQPHDPQLINDTAVMLDYHLDGDQREVEAMYRRALDLVDAQLASTELSPDDRLRFEQTKKDTETNLKYLLDPEARKKAEAAAEAAAAAEKAKKEQAAAAPANAGGGG